MIDPISAFLALGSLIMSGIQDSERKRKERRDAAVYQQELRDYEAAQEKFKLEQKEEQKRVEQYNSPLEQKKRLEAAGLNPYAFLSGGGGNTSMLSLDFTEPPPEKPRESGDSILLQTLLTSVFPSLLKMSVTQTETQNQMRMLEREITEENMYDEENLDALLKESRIINALDRSELSEERLEQMRKDNKITQATIEVSDRIDALLDDYYKTGKMPDMETMKKIGFLLGKKKLLEKAQ